MGLIKEQISETDKVNRRTAVIGLTGVRKTIFDIFSKLSRAEAKAWLAS
jgi:hypothetical protein